MNSSIRKEGVILCGLQISGKTTFYQERFQETHIRISLEQYKTRAKEMKAIKEAVESGESIVIDNTNTTREHRKVYFDVLKAHGYEVTCCYFDAQIKDTIKRNKERPKEERLPDIAIRSAYKKLEIPSYIEGFDHILFISMDEEGFRCVEPANIHNMLSLYQEEALNIKQFVGVNWKEKEPYLEFFDLGKQQFNQIKAEGELELKRMDHKFCTGYYDHNLQEYMPCTSEADLTSSKEHTCSICEALTGFRACIVCRGDICRSKNQAAIERCKKDHALYLAYFPDRVKVGVTRYSRRYERILEQGAIYSMFIGMSNGKDIRRVETAISKLGITPQVTQTYKIKHLSTYPSASSAFAVLLETFEEIKQSLKEEFKVCLIEPEFNDFSEIFKRAYDIQDDIMDYNEYTYDIDQSPHHIQGEIKAMFGSIAMIKCNDKLVAYNLKAMEGFIVATNL